MAATRESVPVPREGLRFVDTAFPDEPWVVAQSEPGSRWVYVRRESDGRLWHYDDESWRHAWDRGFLGVFDASR